MDINVDGLLGWVVKIMFFHFSSSFNIIQRALPRCMLKNTGMDQYLTIWTVDYLANHPQYEGTCDWESDRIICCVGTPQGTVLVPFVFILYATDYRQNSLDWRQCIMYRTNPVNVGGELTSYCPLTGNKGRSTEVVTSYKNLDIHLNSKLEWTRDIFHFIWKVSAVFWTTGGFSWRHCCGTTSLSLCGLLGQQHYSSWQEEEAKTNQEGQRSIYPKCVKERDHRSFHPAALRLYNQHSSQ